MATCQRCQSDRVDYPRPEGVRAFCDDCGAYYEPWEGEPDLKEIERTSAEHHAKLALLLWQGADAFGKVVRTVEDMGRDGYQAIADEELAADRIVMDGPMVIRALRDLAMRLDRSVMVQAGTDD